MALLELQAIFITFASLLTIAIYRLYLHPLAKFPGPLLAKLTSLWIYREAYRGTEASTLAALHAKCGPIIRVAPNELDIADGAALNPIYVKSGGFLKASCYKNFDIDGFPTIFSAIDPSHHSIRSKPVLPLFAQASIRDGKDVIVGRVDRMVSRLEQDAEQSRKSGKPVNILTCAQSLALDTVTSYLFGKSYGGLEEDWEKEDGRLSAAYFVDILVATGRFFYLPPVVFSWLVLILDNFDINFGPDRYLKWKSQVAMDKYVAGIVDEAIAAEETAKEDEGKEDGIDTGTYQTRLLKAGMSRDETIAQCKDIIFAGTDPTGMNLCTICFHLVRNPRM
jgi:cytochrome P450